MQYELFRLARKEGLLALEPHLADPHESEIFNRYPTISKNHLRDMRRQFRLLGEEGRISYNVARQPEEIRRRMEEFLALEASGWKGRKRSAMVMDRFRAAFAREAITNLAEVDAVRIHKVGREGAHGGVPEA